MKSAVLFTTAKNKSNMHLHEELLWIVVNHDGYFLGKAFGAQPYFQCLHTFVVSSKIEPQGRLNKKPWFYFQFIPSFGKTGTSINVSSAKKKCRVIFIFNGLVTRRTFHIKIIGFKKPEIKPS